ncbi:MAG: DUF3333 domain-containing protein, partial [Gammaproteobacteria bacterium]
MNSATTYQQQLPLSPATAMEKVRASLAKRYAKEWRFRVLGRLAIYSSLIFLVILLSSIVANGYTAFQQTFVRLDVHFDQKLLDPEGTGKRAALATADYAGLLKETLRELFPEVQGRRDQRALYALVSPGGSYVLREKVLSDPGLVGQTQLVWVPVDDDVDMLIKGHTERDSPENERRLKDNQLAWIDGLLEKGAIQKQFNLAFFTSGDSREPESAGIKGALMGSVFTLLVTLLLSFPIGVATAIYLEEFAPKNRWTDLIEVNINNLAAVPSIVFG